MNAKSACAGILAMAFLALFVMLAAPHAAPWPATPPGSPAIGTAVWSDRIYDTLLQGVIIFAGVLSILLLLGNNPSGRIPP